MSRQCRRAGLSGLTVAVGAIGRQRQPPGIVADISHPPWEMLGIRPSLDCAALMIESEDDRESGGKPAKSFSRRASSNLRLARRRLEEVDWQPDERARHLVAEANVLALLDLADAIRASRPPAR